MRVSVDEFVQLQWRIERPPDVSVGNVRVCVLVKASSSTPVTLSEVMVCISLSAQVTKQPHERHY